MQKYCFSRCRIECFSSCVGVLGQQHKSSLISAEGFAGSDAIPKNVESQKGDYSIESDKSQRQREEYEKMPEKCCDIRPRSGVNTRETSKS